jgi:hypothetical protein
MRRLVKERPVAWAPRPKTSPSLKRQFILSLRRLDEQVAALPSPDVAGRIIPCFIEAGLPEPKVLWESVVPGSKDDIWLRLFVLTYKNLLPLMQRLGTVDPGVGDPDTLPSASWPKGGRDATKA